MRAGRAEALDIFRKWFAERALLRCEGHFSTVAFSLRGRFLAVDDDELRILADDTASELVVRLTPQVGFGYADARGIGIPNSEYDRCVVIFFGSATVAIAEIKT
jgi:hypothetical protein